MVMKNAIENRVLSRIFGPIRYEFGDWRRLYNEELHSLYRSPNIVKVIKFRRLSWAEHVTRMKKGSAFKIVTGKPLGEIPLRRPRRKWQENILIELKERDVNTRIWNNINLRIVIIGDPLVMRH